MPLQEIDSEGHKLLQDIADRLAKSHKILVITGAGISTSCGIPVMPQTSAIEFLS
jgi:hypothetical protein